MRAAIWARTLDGSIGKDGKLLIHDKEDLKRFRDITTGFAIVMGRATFESLPRILPNRKHIVLSSKEHLDKNPEVLYYRSIEEVLSNHQDFIVIGGGSIYSQMLDHIDTIYETVFHSTLSGDTLSPKIPIDWTLYSDEYKLSESGNLVSFLTWRK